MWCYWALQTNPVHVKHELRENLEAEVKVWWLSWVKCSQLSFSITAFYSSRKSPLNLRRQELGFKWVIVLVQSLWTTGDNLWPTAPDSRRDWYYLRICGSDRHFKPICEILDSDKDNKVYSTSNLPKLDHSNGSLWHFPRKCTENPQRSMEISKYTLKNSNKHTFL